ncbi:hypothetical protein BKA65DRAFT_542468 [Rhexocercosporidium sp. MPI-PUGE-AT-0058]|nr:hypothetical protein BKA65DRAFT_542468 [Rhexocercosporidium sp. MPI-PUGE-AT-0058]
MDSPHQPKLHDLLGSLWNSLTQQDSENVRQEVYQTEESEFSRLDATAAHASMSDDDYSGSAGIDKYQGPDITERSHNGDQSAYASTRSKIVTGVQNAEAGSERGKKLKTFPPFPRLTSELRIKIWELNLPAPRSLTQHPDYVSEDTHGQSAVCPLFNACFESNEIIKKFYPLCFEDQLMGYAIRFCPARDTVIFPDYGTMRNFYPHAWFGYAPLMPSEKQAFKLIKHLVVRYDFLMGVVLPPVEQFENLDTLEVEGKSA